MGIMTTLSQGRISLLGGSVVLLYDRHFIYLLAAWACLRSFFFRVLIFFFFFFFFASDIFVSELVPIFGAARHILLSSAALRTAPSFFFYFHFFRDRSGAGHSRHSRRGSSDLLGVIDGSIVGVSASFFFLFPSVRTRLVFFCSSPLIYYQATAYVFITILLDRKGACATCA